jgi:phosphonate transport system permease protein
MIKLSRRRWVIISILIAGLWSCIALDLNPAELAAGAGGLKLAGEFLAHALQPALQYESAVPDGTTPILLRSLQAAMWTIVFAATAISLAVVIGILFGFTASTAWWSEDLTARDTTWRRILTAYLAPTLYAATRVLINLMRSIHELLWAVLLLTAFGINHLSAAIAIAIPSAGTLAKIFAEMIDETPRGAALAMRDAGATPLQIYFIGLLPRALPDIAAYTLYRFECALRTSAVLGFFGFPTLGFYIAASFENLHYAEVWTYLYALFTLVALVDWWSGRLRRSMLLWIPTTA